MFCPLQAANKINCTYGFPGMRPGGRGLDGSIGGRNPLNPPGPGGWRPSGNGNPVKKKQDWLRTDLRAVYRGLVLIKCKFSF